MIWKCHNLVQHMHLKSTIVSSTSTSKGCDLASSFFTLPAPVVLLSGPIQPIRKHTNVSSITSRNTNNKGKEQMLIETELNIKSETKCITMDLAIWNNSRESLCISSSRRSETPCSSFRSPFPDHASPVLLWEMSASRQVAEPVLMQLHSSPA